ncbi:MAG: peptidylprolyl isomerase [Chthoniobacterales bacterium]
MNRAVRNILFLLVAAAVGWPASEVLYRATWSRDLIGSVLGRGKFVAVVRGRAIHERDFSGDAAAETMVVADALRRSAGNGEVVGEDVEREFNLLRWQFGDNEKFSAALAASGITEASLRAVLADYLAVRREVEIGITPKLSVTDEECRKVYAETPQRFALPRRFRASHIFVAAPDGSPDEVMLEKRRLAQGLSIRLLAEKDFAALAAEASEDEATKLNGGDLNYFSEMRALPGFILALEKLEVGQTSSPVRSRLGFHIIRLAEVLPEHALRFDEARVEIAVELANQKRATAVEELRARLKTPRLAGRH